MIYSVAKTARQIIHRILRLKKEIILLSTIKPNQIKLNG
jgi:hypothetical protein